MLVDTPKKTEETQKNTLSWCNGEFTEPPYSRMVNEENLHPQLDVCSPLEIHRNEAREVLFKFRELMRLYFDFRATRQPYGAEALGLMSYSLREQLILLTLTVEFWVTLSQVEQRNPTRLQGMQGTKATVAIPTGSAFDYLGLTAQFGHQSLMFYSAELAKEMPKLFIRLLSPVRTQLLERIAGFTKDHPYPEVHDNMRDLQPVLQAIQADVEKQLMPGQSAKALDKPLGLSLPSEGKPSGVNGL